MDAASSDSVPGTSIDDFLESPPNDATLWRYMPTLQLVRMLESSALWFSRVDLLGDPYEGSMTRVAAEQRQALVRELTESEPGLLPLLERYSPTKLLRKGLFVSCWHESPHESDAMWRLYGRDAGVAIRTSAERLSRELTSPEAVDSALANIWLGRVQYINYERDGIPLWNIIAPALNKRIAFSHEREVRAIFLDFAWARAEDVPPTWDYEREAPRGHDVSVRLANLIEGIAVNPSADTWVVDAIRKLVEWAGLDVDVTHSELGREPIW